MNRGRMGSGVRAAGLGVVTLCMGILTVVPLPVEPRLPLAPPDSNKLYVKVYTLVVN